MTIPQYQLVDFWVEPKNLLLWPNNPRLKISSFDDLDYTPEQLCSSNVQNKLYELMLKEEHNVKEIIESIGSQGYTNLNSIIVKRVSDTDRFIVLEGNRRTSAIRYWLENIGELSDEVAETLKKIPAKEFIHDGEEDFLQIFQLLSQMHIAGPKSWTPIQQAHMVSQTYDGLLKREGEEEEEEDGFVYEARIAKECAKILGQKWTEVKKDLAIYRIFKQLQASQFMVEHEHYSKIKMVFDANHVFKDYFGLNIETFELSNQGLDRFNDLFLEKDAAIGNPQDFRQLKYIYQNGDRSDVELLRASPRSLGNMYEKAKRGLMENACLHALQGTLKSLRAIKPAEMQCNELEKGVLNEIKAITQQLFDLHSGLVESDNFEATPKDIQKDEDEGEIDIEVEGSLNSSDEIDDRYDDTFYFKDYTLDNSSLSASRSFQIDLTSSDFDAFLYVFNGDSNEHMDSDDNSGEGLNARLQIKNDPNIEYRIRVTSAEPEVTGQFKLYIQEIH